MCTWELSHISTITWNFSSDLTFGWNPPCLRVESAECKSLISIGHAWNRMWSGRAGRPHAAAAAKDKSEIPLSLSLSLPRRFYGPRSLALDNEYAVYLNDGLSFLRQLTHSIRSSCGPLSNRRQEKAYDMSLLRPWKVRGRSNRYGHCMCGPSKIHMNMQKWYVAYV